VNYGPDAKPAHTHLPTAEAIEKVVASFAANGINVHFDLGDNHQGIPGVIPSLWARGGEVLDEMATVCQRSPGDPDAVPPVPPDPEFVCQFSGYPGTVGWKSGFRALRDALKQPDPNVPLDALDHPCDVPGNDGPGEACERVFDSNRKDMFRYLFCIF